MIGLLQRVSRASVEVGEETIAAIDRGILALVCAERGDDERSAARLLERLLGYRVFPDAAGKMNLSVQEVQGGLLLVPQFTLGADTATGMRPGFSSAAAPELACSLFAWLVERARSLHTPIANGRFGAHMRVSLVNDGPVTFWLRVAPQGRNGRDARPQEN